jgi:hypothetical protein
MHLLDTGHWKRAIDSWATSQARTHALGPSGKDSIATQFFRRLQPAVSPWYAKRPQKPIDHDLYAGGRRCYDRPGAYGHPANESVPLAHSLRRHKMIAPSAAVSVFMDTGHQVEEL